MSPNLVLKTGNGIIQTGNGIVAPISRLGIKKVLNITHFCLEVQTKFYKQEMELFKQEMELFLLFPNIGSKNFFYKSFQP